MPHSPHTFSVAHKECCDSSGNKTRRWTSATSWQHSSRVEGEPAGKAAAGTTRQYDPRSAARSCPPSPRAMMGTAMHQQCPGNQPHEERRPHLPTGHKTLASTQHTRPSNRAPITPCQPIQSHLLPFCMAWHCLPGRAMLAQPQPRPGCSSYSALLLTCSHSATGQTNSSRQPNMVVTLTTSLAISQRHTHPLAHPQAVRCPSSTMMVGTLHPYTSPPSSPLSSHTLLLNTSAHHSSGVHNPAQQLLSSLSSVSNQCPLLSCSQPGLFQLDQALMRTRNPALQYNEHKPRVHLAKTPRIFLVLRGRRRLARRTARDTSRTLAVVPSPSLAVTAGRPAEAPNPQLFAARRGSDAPAENGFPFHVEDGLEFIGSQFAVFGPMIFAILGFVAWRSARRGCEQPECRLLVSRFQ